MDLSEEKTAVGAAREIRDKMGVRDTKVLTLDEFTEEVDQTPEWLNTESQNHIIRATLYGDPELPMIKTVDEILNETQTQITYKEQDEIFYICPTTNKFTKLNQLQS